MKKIIIFNFKSSVLNKTTRQEIYKIFLSANPIIYQKNNIILAPASYYFFEFQEKLKNIKNLNYAGQNVFWLNKILATGETPPLMLKDLSIKYALIGHSERKEFLKEDEKMINLKLKACFQTKIMPIICFGEKEILSDFQVKKIIFSQLNQIFQGINLKQEKFLLAYEPVWAIGTKKTPSQEEIINRIKMIRFWLARRFNEKISHHTPILYGGSVSAANIENFLSTSNLNGVLIGSQSTQKKSLEKILSKIVKS